MDRKCSSASEYRKRQVSESRFPGALKPSKSAECRLDSAKPFNFNRQMAHNDEEEDAISTSSGGGNSSFCSCCVLLANISRHVSKIEEHFEKFERMRCQEQRRRVTRKYNAILQRQREKSDQAPPLESTMLKVPHVTKSDSSTVEHGPAGEDTFAETGMRHKSQATSEEPSPFVGIVYPIGDCRVPTMADMDSKPSTPTEGDSIGQGSTEDDISAETVHVLVEDEYGSSIDDFMNRSVVDKLISIRIQESCDSLCRSGENIVTEMISLADRPRENELNGLNTLDAKLNTSNEIEEMQQCVEDLCCELNRLNTIETSLNTTSEAIKTQQDMEEGCCELRVPTTLDRSLESNKIQKVEDSCELNEMNTVETGLNMTSEPSEIREGMMECRYELNGLDTMDSNLNMSSEPNKIQEKKTSCELNDLNTIETSLNTTSELGETQEGMIECASLNVSSEPNKVQGFEGSCELKELNTVETSLNTTSEPSKILEDVENYCELNELFILDASLNPSNEPEKIQDMEFCCESNALHTLEAFLDTSSKSSKTTQVMEEGCNELYGQDAMETSFEPSKTQQDMEDDYSKLNVPNALGVKTSKQLKTECIEICCGNYAEHLVPDLNQDTVGEEMCNTITIPSATFTGDDRTSKAQNTAAIFSERSDNELEEVGNEKIASGKCLAEEDIDQFEKPKDEDDSVTTYQSLLHLKETLSRESVAALGEDQPPNLEQASCCTGFQPNVPGSTRDIGTNLLTPGRTLELREIYFPGIDFRTIAWHELVIERDADDNIVVTLTEDVSLKDLLCVIFLLAASVTIMLLFPPSQCLPL